MDYLRFLPSMIWARVRVADLRLLVIVSSWLGLLALLPDPWRQRMLTTDLARHAISARPQSGSGSHPSIPGGTPTLARVQIDLVAIVVEDYDPAIKFFVDALGFDLVEDSPSLTNDGRAKRWVVVRPPGGQTGILLARADGQRQAAVVGDQVAGRVGFFLRVNDFDAAYERMTAAGVRFVTSSRTESYGRVAVFLDAAGNRWDLLGPA
jgi:catechol 2,3-dioxygenase-like lactoylglutathione lyase family enzyme